MEIFFLVLIAIIAGLIVGAIFIAFFYLVGGWIRDLILKKKAKQIANLPMENMEELTRSRNQPKIERSKEDDEREIQRSREFERIRDLSTNSGTTASGIESSASSHTGLGGREGKQESRDSWNKGSNEVGFNKSKPRKFVKLE